MDKKSKIIPFPQDRIREPGRYKREHGADAVDILEWQRTNFILRNDIGANEEGVIEARRMISEMLEKAGPGVVVKEACLCRNIMGYLYLIVEFSNRTVEQVGVRVWRSPLDIK